VYFLKLDEERYYLGLAASYMNSMGDIAHYPKDARRELRNALALRTGPGEKLREAYETIVFAKSYLIEKEYEEATRLAKEALVQAQAANSKENIARVVALGNTLLRSDYGKKNENVEELIVAVTTAQHPELFSPN
jgi:squalene cyclase